LCSLNVVLGLNIWSLVIAARLLESGSQNLRTTRLQGSCKTSARYSMAGHEALAMMHS
jgi:hypothetical protein